MAYLAWRLPGGATRHELPQAKPALGSLNTHGHRRFQVGSAPTPPHAGCCAHVFTWLAMGHYQGSTSSDRDRAPLLPSPPSQQGAGVAAESGGAVSGPRVPAGDYAADAGDASWHRRRILAAARNGAATTNWVTVCVSDASTCPVVWVVCDAIAGAGGSAQAGGSAAAAGAAEGGGC